MKPPRLGLQLNSAQAGLTGKRVRILLLWSSIALQLGGVTAGTPSVIQSSKPWTWTDAHRVERTRADLAEILDEHKLWINSDGKQGHRADLSSATMDGAALQGAQMDKALLNNARLNRADLGGAHLDQAQLKNAELLGANLQRAALVGADLRGANLYAAHLSHSDLSEAWLNGAELVGSDLSGAGLLETHLNDADLSDTNLSEVDFTLADLRGAKFEPNANPTGAHIAEAAHIEFLTYAENPSALMRLRKQLEDDGFRAAERKITYALRRNEAARSGWGEKWFNTVAFDWTSQYGMNPGRTLLIWLWLFLVCSVVYGGFIHHSGESGFILATRSAQKTSEERLSPHPVAPGPPWIVLFRLVGREVRVAYYALYFSLQTAFSLGVWDFNFGKWLHQFPRVEFELKPKGWARPVAATQAILSVSLIVLWVLTYFGRPFE